MAQAAVLAGPDPVVLDLGCGTGSTLRTLGPHLPDNARWHLVDNDPALLERAATEAPGPRHRPPAGPARSGGAAAGWRDAGHGIGPAGPDARRLDRRAGHAAGRCRRAVLCGTIL
ncbi:methyltransferase domain-containing protein [Paracoccus sp. NBH48]|uniref:methyltransferase domain-containing protein n=1 Tax=Paracoccus sp. NBH48 TaxID=2596918 RepID=UPI00351C4283